MQRDSVKEEKALSIKLQLIKRGNSQEVGKMEKWKYVWFHFTIILQFISINPLS